MSWRQFGEKANGVVIQPTLDQSQVSKKGTGAPTNAIFDEGYALVGAFSNPRMRSALVATALGGMKHLPDQASAALDIFVESKSTPACAYERLRGVLPPGSL